MKKNLQKIPSLILEQIRTFDQDDVIVAAVKKISIEELADYKHLGIGANGVELVLPSPQLPDPEAGRYSHANVYGKEINDTNIQRVFDASKAVEWFIPERPDLVCAGKLWRNFRCRNPLSRST